MQTVEFYIKLPANQYVNPNRLCFSIRIRRSSKTANDIDPAMIMVNNFFAHWIKEIEIRRLGDDLEIIPNSSIDIDSYYKNI